MRTVRTVLLAGAAALGLAGLALAAGPVYHEMTIRLPGGGVEHIRYTGNLAPKVMLVSGPAMPVAAGSGFWSVAYPFAELDRVSAMMDRQLAAMMDQARAMQQLAPPSGLDQAVLKDAPPGTSSYSMITTMSGNGFCSRSVQITSSPDGGKPKVVSNTSGNCGVQPGTSAPSASVAAPQPQGLQTISLKALHPVPSPKHGI